MSESENPFEATFLSAKSLKMDSVFIHPDERAGASGPWLVNRLKDEGLSPHSHSGISTALKCLAELREFFLSKRSPGHRPLDEHFQFFSQSFGADFLTKALHWGYDSGLRLSHDQWKQLKKANPNVASPGNTSTDRNKAWESVIGSIAKTFCSHVTFAEPDIICTFGEKKIAVAAKMVYSEDNLLANVRKAFNQSKEAGRAGTIDAYLIFVNIVNIYPFLDTFKLLAKSNLTPDAIKQKLKKDVTVWCDRLPLLKEAKRLREETNRPVGVGFFIPFTLVLAGNPMPFFYVHMPLTWTVESEEYLFAQKFLQACGIVLGYPHERNCDGAKTQ